MATTLTNIIQTRASEYIHDSIDSTSDHSPLYETINTGKKKKLVCNINGCGKVFPFKSEMQRHIASHGEIRPFKCTFPDCGRTFKRDDALKDHVRGTHTRETPLVCTHPGCGTQFTTAAKLRYHYLLHNGEKPFKCSIPNCDKAFVTSSQLKQHEKSSLVHKHLEKKGNSKRKTSTESNLLTNDTPCKEESISTSGSTKRLKIEPSLPISFPTLSFDPSSIYNSIPLPDCQPFSYNPNTHLDQPLVEKLLRVEEILIKEVQDTTNLLLSMQSQIYSVKDTLPEGLQQFITILYNDLRLVGTEADSLLHPSYLSDDERKLYLLALDNLEPGDRFVKREGNYSEEDFVNYSNFMNFCKFLNRLDNSVINTQRNFMR